AEAARIARRRESAPDAAGVRAAAPAAAQPDTTASEESGLPHGAARRECRGLARAAVRLDSDALDRQLEAFVRHHGVVAAWERLMMPTLHAVGRKWETAGDRYVEVEHLLSWHVSTALRSAPLLHGSPPMPGRDGSPVLLACVPGEQHTLPLEALHAALRRLGHPVRMLGAALPAEALVAAVRRTGPDHVVLWSQTRSQANVPLALYLQQEAWGIKGARRHTTLVLAGPGWRGARPAVAGSLQPAGLREALALLSPGAAPV
ncbi:transcriptional regulator, partial [Streptomyces sp. SID5785]